MRSPLSFLQAEQTQLLLTELPLQTPHHPRGPPLDAPQ